MWQQANAYCEVWCESPSIAGVIEDDCRELAVSLYPAGGCSSATLAYEVVQAINYYAADGRPVVILYIGDFDPAGVLIEVAIERELRLDLDAGSGLDFGCIAITAPPRPSSLTSPGSRARPATERAAHPRNGRGRGHAVWPAARALRRAAAGTHACRRKGRGTRTYFDTIARLKLTTGCAVPLSGSGALGMMCKARPAFPLHRVGSPF